MDDTASLELSRIRDAVLHQPPVERLHAMLALSESMRAIGLAGLRARYPDRSTIELVELMAGESLVACVRHGPVKAR